MALPRQFSLGVGLATAALVWGIYQVALPSAADVRVGPANDRDAGASERTATWASAAAVSAVSLLAKDPTVFVLGGSMTVVMAWWMRHSNAYDPALGSVLGASSRQVQQSSMDDGAGYSPAV